MLGIKNQNFHKVSNGSNLSPLAFAYLFPGPALKKSRVMQSDAATSKAAPNPNTERLSGSEDSESEPEELIISLKDKTKDIDAFFNPSEKVGGKPRRACILCKCIRNF